MSTRARAPRTAVDGEVMEARVVRHGSARWLIAAGVVAALALLAFGATLSPFLAVDRIEVRGAQRVPAARVETAAGVAKGDAMVWLDTGDAVHDIEALPYVQGAKVTKEWPHTVQIVVTERDPVAWATGPAGNVIVDRTGRVLEVVQEQPTGIPELLGLTALADPGGSVTPAGPARAAGVLNPLGAAGTTSITATRDGLTMQLANGVEVRLGDGTQLRAKVAAATAVLGSLGGQPVTYVDVSVPTNPVAG